MTNVTFSKKQFEKEIGILNEQTKNKIEMFGTSIENINEQQIELEITPNRPDLLSYQGFKRSFLAFLGKKTGFKKYKIKKPAKNYEVVIDSSVKSIRPCTACAIVKGLNLNDEKIKEIIDIQEKLHASIGRNRKKIAIGIYPLEKIKLPIVYKAIEPDKIKFIPLDSEKQMSGLEILQKHLTGREYAHLLAGKPKFPIFIDANKNILSMPPIINSQLTGKITEQTKDIFIECSGFDFEILSKCITIITTALSDMQGQIYQMQIKYDKKELTPNLKPEKMKLNLQNVNKLLDLNLKETQIKTLLERMGYDYSKSKVTIPPWRLDILHEVDLIEDIAIAYGYENFSPELQKISTIGEEDEKATLKRKICEILAGLEMLEISNYHLTNKKDQFIKMGLQEKSEKLIEVEESKTDYNILRNNLSHYLLKTLSENIDAEYPQKIFEIGRVFKFYKNETEEKKYLALALTPGNFTETKQVLEYIFRMINLEIILKEPKHFPSWFIDGRCAEITLDKKNIGFLGEIHPKILKKWHIKMPVALCEISLDEVFEKLI